MIWLALSVAHALEPSCIVSWDDLREGGRSAPLGARIQATPELAVVYDGETTRPLLGLPTTCELGADGPVGTPAGDRIVTFDKDAKAVTWHQHAGGAWSEVARYDGPFAHEALVFGEAFAVGEERFAIATDAHDGLRPQGLRPGPPPHWTGWIVAKGGVPRCAPEHLLLKPSTIALAPTLRERRRGAPRPAVMSSTRSAGGRT